MSGSDEYDPGFPYEPPPRRRRRLSEEDDAWAAADDDDLADDGVAIEDLAAGYGWQDDDRYGQEPAEVPPRTEPPPLVTPLPRRTRTPSRPSAARRYGEDYAYRQSRSYHRDRARRGEYGEYHGPVTPPPPSRSKRRPARPDSFGWVPPNLPYWQILVLVALSVLALLAVVLACAALWVVL